MGIHKQFRKTSSWALASYIIGFSLALQNSAGANEDIHMIYKIDGDNRIVAFTNPTLASSVNWGGLVNGALSAQFEHISEGEWYFNPTIAAGTHTYYSEDGGYRKFGSGYSWFSTPSEDVNLVLGGRGSSGVYGGCPANVWGWGECGTECKRERCELG